MTSCFLFFFWGGGGWRGGGLTKIPSEKGSTLNGKNLVPKGANSFLIMKTRFRRKQYQS